jgi:hypothetical protein
VRVIGLGAGRSDVRAQVQVYEVMPSGSRPIDTIAVEGRRARRPHLVSTAVSSGMHVACKMLGATSSPTPTAPMRASQAVRHAVHATGWRRR